MRPYLSFSIDQLEAEYERARPANDIGTLRKLVGELKFRTTTRAKRLLDAIKKEINPPKASGEEASERPAGNRTTNAAKKPSAKRGSGFRPTDEQAEALSYFQSDKSLKINAYAGTGKTSTLQLLANETTRRGQYIAFNKAIVTEASGKFPQSVNCATTHGLAFKAVMPRFLGQQTKLLGRINANELAEVLGLKKWRVDQHHALAPRSQGYIIQETIRRFAQSADHEPNVCHVPQHGALLSASDETLRLVQDFALRGANHVWSRMLNPDDPLPLGHDGYLKLWALSEPSILADYILLDEAQDTNPVVLDVLKKQQAQMVYVGDKYQQIYEWRGAVNAMEIIETAHNARLTTSFRFGQTLADAANAILSLLGEVIPLRGNPAMTTSIADGWQGATILARTNGATIASVIEALDNNKRPHLVGGNGDLMTMLKGVQELKAGQPSVVPDFFGFTSWQEVVDFAKSGEGSHLLTFVNLVETRGERQLMWALNRTVAEENADVVISTAHKAKGQEWPSVRLLDDFLKSRANGKEEAVSPVAGFEPSELRLFYVALTRAKSVLSLPSSYHALVGIQ